MALVVAFHVCLFMFWQDDEAFCYKVSLGFPYLSNLLFFSIVEFSLVVVFLTSLIDNINIFRFLTRREASFGVLCWCVWNGEEKDHPLHWRCIFETSFNWLPESIRTRMHDQFGFIDCFTHIRSTLRYATQPWQWSSSSSSSITAHWN